MHYLKAVGVILGKINRLKLWLDVDISDHFKPKLVLDFKWKIKGLNLTWIVIISPHRLFVISSSVSVYIDCSRFVKYFYLSQIILVLGYSVLISFCNK